MAFNCSTLYRLGSILPLFSILLKDGTLYGVIYWLCCTLDIAVGLKLLLDLCEFIIEGYEACLCEKPGYIGVFL